MRPFRFALALLFLGLLLLQSVQGQQARQRSKNLGFAALTGNSALHKELNLSSEQQATLQKASTDARQAIQAAQNLEDKARLQKNRQANQNLREVISKTCNQEQQQRLFQIEIQWSTGSWMLLRSELASTLNLSPEQIRQIRSLSQKSQEKVRQLRKSRNDQNRQEVQDKINSLLAETRTNALQLLDCAQQLAWKMAQGKTFELPPRKKAKKP